ncbi:MAG: glyceraldehyde 3-phosphate dehydrogenase [Candidatus Midichloriaceae bacterium]|jgi:glyceraldehyde 3-phosphate dehydrogenase
MQKRNFAINGIGRIGKNIFRKYFEQENNNWNLSAINLGEANIESKIHLLKYDSVHGMFLGIEDYNDNEIIVRGKKIKIITERNIENIEWGKLGVDVVLECTGQFNTREKAALHIKKGAARVLVSAPCKNADKTIIRGVNCGDISSQDTIISVASCTTNCLAPIAKVINDDLGIESGFMTTIHSYTNDQRIIDGGHKDLRRARSAALSIIPTSTGAVKSMDLVLPELKGKLGCSAIRVPTPNVSMIDFTFNSSKDTSVKYINDLFKGIVKENNYKGIVDYVSEKLVSVDFNHTTASAIFDSTETSVIKDRLCRVVAWYDNEWAFSCRMFEILEKL